MGPEGTAAFFGTALGAVFLGADFLMGIFLTGAALVFGVLVVFLTIVLADLTVVLGWLFVLAEERTLTLATFFPIKKYYSLKAVNPKQAFLPNHHPLPKTPTAEQTISFCILGAPLAARYSCSGQKDKNDKYQHSLRLWRGPPKSLRVTCFFWLETAGSSNNLWCKGEILLPLLFWGLLP